MFLVSLGCGRLHIRLSTKRKQTNKQREIATQVRFKAASERRSNISQACTWKRTQLISSKLVLMIHFETKFWPALHALHPKVQVYLVQRGVGAGRVSATTNEQSKQSKASKAKQSKAKQSSSPNGCDHVTVRLSAGASTCVRPSPTPRSRFQPGP